MGGVSFQPVSFTGRDEEISDADRHRQRYTISHMAHEFERHTGGKIDRYRDWFPLGAFGQFSALADHLRSLQGPEGPNFGSLACSCHPNCGASLLLVANRKTKEWSTLTQFFDIEQCMKDFAVICDTARGRELTVAQVGALLRAQLRRERRRRRGSTLSEFIKLFYNGKLGGVLGEKKREEDWTVLWVGGMWFQDLWTYDFRRTEMCVIPYGTQEGEISFCAYNTGVGWRQVVENMHTVAKTKEWFKTRGRHQIYAGDKPMPLPQGEKKKLPLVGAQPAVPPGAHITGGGH